MKVGARTSGGPGGNSGPGDADERELTPLSPFDIASKPISVSRSFGMLLFIASIAVLGWGRLKM